MNQTRCVSCHKEKAPLECVSCKGNLCKSCAQFVDEHTFSFLSQLPAGLEPGSYCVQCYDTKAAPEVQTYEKEIAAAHEISIFMKNQSKEVRSLKRAQFPVKVEDCDDRDDVLLRLAFLTVHEGYDTLINVEVAPKKVGAGSYQKQVWSGVGTPAVGRQKGKKA